jgi:enamine deaminase RidA (YjgF/YER057c/UK114 family)
VIRPERSPNTGLPYSPGILVGNTLYLSGHLGRDPVTAKLVPGGIEAETLVQSLALDCDHLQLDSRAVVQCGNASAAASRRSSRGR